MSDIPPLPPPDPVKQKWWERSAIRGMIGTTLFALVPYGTKLIMNQVIDRASIAATYETLIIGWFMALGLTTTTTAMKQMTGAVLLSIVALEIWKAGLVPLSWLTG